MGFAGGINKLPHHPHHYHRHGIDHHGGAHHHHKHHPHHDQLSGIQPQAQSLQKPPGGCGCIA